MGVNARHRGQQASRSAAAATARNSPRQPEQANSMNSVSMGDSIDIRIRHCRSE
jgi:hypothetical protein